LDADTRTAQLRLRFKNPGEELKPNMFAQVTIQHRDEGEQVLLVPNQSIIRSGIQDRVVLAMGGGRFKSINVRTGRRGDASTEILQGLEAGDLVVISAHFLLDSESSISSDFMRMSMPETVSVSAGNGDGNGDEKEDEKRDESQPAAPVQEAKAY
jgi:membrane fusion protein, copper/silver efflux system